MAKIIRKNGLAPESVQSTDNVEIDDNEQEDTELSEEQQESSTDTHSKRADALQRARVKRQENIDAGIVEKKRTPLEQWQDDPTSIRKSVNARCYQCNGEENYVNRARFCIVFDCALWVVRPFGKGITKDQCRDYQES